MALGAGQEMHEALLGNQVHSTWKCNPLQNLVAARTEYRQLTLSNTIKQKQKTNTTSESFGDESL